MSPELARLDEAAHALSGFRVLANGEGRAYTATWFPGAPWQGAARFVNQCRALGYLTQARDDSYALLDVLDEQGSIIQDFGIPHARAWAFVKRKLKLAVADED